jgi:hypothetical protein
MVRALVAIGWPLTEQARRLGVSTQKVWQIASAKYPTITEANACDVRSLFECLSATPGGSVRAVNDARRKGWLPPLAWDDIDDPHAEPSVGSGGEGIVDEVAVERALAGAHIDLTDAELAAALQAGTARGEPLSALSARLGMNHMAAKRLLNGELPARMVRHNAIADVLRSPDRPTLAAVAERFGVSREQVRRVWRQQVRSESPIAS